MLQFNPSCTAANFCRFHYFAHILQMPLLVIVLYNQQTKVACGSTDQHFAVSRDTLHDNGKGQVIYRAQYFPPSMLHFA